MVRSTYAKLEHLDFINKKIIELIFKLNIPFCIIETLMTFSYLLDLRPKLYPLFPTNFLKGVQVHVEVHCEMGDSATLTLAYVETFYRDSLPP